jgi:DNA-binding transcriptional MerR regulator
MARASKPSGEVTIGELSKRTGVSVKTLRFYSDQGLLEVRSRNHAGYRHYGEEAVVRLELIRTLRDAGLGLDRIRAVVSRELPLAEALRLQLRAVNAHLVALTQIASALRATLRSEPTEHDLRRLVAVTRLSNEERQAVIESFYDKVSAGSRMDASWKRSMVDASLPTLPEEPTSEQLDAFLELAEIVQDPDFIASMRASVQETWTPDFDVAAYKRVADAMVAEVRAQLARGVLPASAEARDAVERCLLGFAAAMNKQPDEAFRRALGDRFVRQDPRASRYWELVGILRGHAPQPDGQAWPHAEWAFFLEAARHHTLLS